MVDFQIQADNDIPASKQLYSQIRLAIASRKFPPGHRLPSTRQLAMQTGLHRNTISKVYRQLEDTGLVEAQAGSGIYVRSQGNEGGSNLKSLTFDKYPNASNIVKSSLDELLSQGSSLNEAREMLLSEIDWRYRCSARVLVTAPFHDIGIGKLMTKELEQALNIAVELVPIEELNEVINQISAGTIITSRYFIKEAEEIAVLKPVRVIPIDTYDYAQELQLLNTLPKGSYCGFVSLSSGVLRAAELIIHGWRGNDIVFMPAIHTEIDKINAIVRVARIIVCDRFSFDILKDVLQKNREDIIRPPEIICIENYIVINSINLLKRELGLG
ncbi:MAG: GntR family transcriptional regulator [Trichodesmium sp. ALOHA_ZT_67]|nr:GntR family transcriptional regulator [Trichodesmium sp. ALOHA_ZT_67]